jgi:predicted nucleic acid-binding protein
MKRFVLDASVALSWIFEDEYSAYAEFVAEVVVDGQAVVPVVWPLEIANVLLIATRRGRLAEHAAPALLGSLSRLRIEFDRGIPLESLAQSTLSIGSAPGVSAYDASYLELAMRRGLPLATLDERLARAASSAGIDILRP